MHRLFGLALLLSLFGCVVEHRKGPPPENHRADPEPEPEPERPQWTSRYSKTLKYGTRIPEMHAAGLQAMKKNGWRIEDEGRYKDDFSDIKAFKHGGQTVLTWHSGRHDHRSVTTLEVVSNRLTNAECKEEFWNIHTEVARIVNENGDD